MIGTVVSHGRYQNPEEFTQDFCPGMPHPNQFPPPPFEMQFNPQLGPPQGMFPRMGGPPPPLFPNQVIEQPRPPLLPLPYPPPLFPNQLMERPPPLFGSPPFAQNPYSHYQNFY